MNTNQTEELRALSLQEMEETCGGVNKEALCGTLNMLAVAGPMVPWRGVGFSIGCVLGAWAADCYSPVD